MIASWPDRLLAVPVRLFLFFCAAVAEDPPAYLVAALVILTVLTALWLLRLERPPARHPNVVPATDTDEPDDDQADDIDFLAEVFDFPPPPTRHDHRRTPPNRHTDAHPTSRQSHRRRTRI